jgi:hypothetical protein
VKRVYLVPGQGIGRRSQGFLIWYAAPAPAQFFEQALVAKLLSISEVLAIIGNSIYKTGLPQTHDLGANGPALTYEIPSKPYGHVLTGGDGTAVARVKLGAWSYSYGTSKMLVEALWNGIDGIPGQWGNGSCQIMSVVQQDDTDEPIAPKTKSDQWVYRVNQEYAVKYRVTIPTLS